MTRYDKEQNAAYQRMYYRAAGRKQAVTDNKRLNYWRKKYMLVFNCARKDIEGFTEQRLRKEIDEGMSTV